MDANVEAKRTRSRDEVFEALRRSFLWNGEKAYFEWNDSGSIGEFSVSADFPDEAELLFGTFEDLLGRGWSARDAFLDAFMSTKTVYVHDSKGCLLHDDFMRKLGRGIDGESELTPIELASFEAEYRAKIDEYDELVSDFAVIGDGEQGGFEELTPLSLYCAMLRGRAISTEEDFRHRYWRCWRVIDDEVIGRSAAS